jgi:hypothetical protein
VRMLAPPFLVGRPSGARIRTRLRLSSADEAVLWEVGRWLGTLAGRDLAARCSGDHDRTGRKQALTVSSSSRWAGAITRTSNDQWQRGFSNLLDRRAGLRRATRKLQARLAVPVGSRLGRTRGYATQAERFQKQRRLQRLLAELVEVERRVAERRVSVCRGGRRLAKLRHDVAVDSDLNREGGKDGSRIKLTKDEWCARWQAARLFLPADGEADKPWGNETIRVHPAEHWLELRLPTSLAHLSNTPGGRASYRLSCPVIFTYRHDEWAAQAGSGAVRYDIGYDPTRGRWYLDASWRIPAVQEPTLAELSQERAVGVDLNAGHIDGWVLDPSGNPVGPPHTIPLDLDGLPASTRDGRLRAVVSACIRLATAHNCRSVVIENLDFTDARQAGREKFGHGSRGKTFRRTVAGIPTRQFRDLLVGMAANAGVWVIAVDPGWTSTWGRYHWKQPLTQSTKPAITVTGHHAAAVVIGRRGLGLSARRRPGVTRPHQRMGKGELPARPDGGSWAARDPDLREASGRRPSRTRPVGLNGAGSATRWSKTVWDHPSGAHRRS